VVSLKFIVGLFVFILLVHILAVVNFWYWTYRWMDIPMHFLGGFWLGLIFLYSIMPKLEITSHKLLIAMILVVSFAVLIGVFWEFIEFSFDVSIVLKWHLPLAQQGLADTMKDLFFDLLGGFVAWVIYKFNINKKSYLAL